jgi:hypothetical protein
LHDVFALLKLCISQDEVMNQLREVLAC